ncbi:hypothetical protein AQUSIP_22140 [Aquicella siphonis]|uniref:Type II secretion system protein G n=1 Tax=Aquicella siphonis TaxID=254247 RepID=A0A5E4PKF0_9COXI|nr:prepilin-type N-terminal cleavage/methylation domain-containing protein [Aquicella siphonis]VVC76887.1 hypothetical protein AQUSIP_22140 [Aquicella siphonis]
MKARKNVTGFTLIEILLVLVIISIIIFASVGYVQQRALQLRMDRTTTQMQQILNAGLSYYVQEGHWPTALSDLQGTYLPPVSVTLKNPWGNDYAIDSASNPKLFYVYTRVNTVSAKGAFAAASVIAGTLPFAYTSNDGSGAPPSAASPCTSADTSCYIVAAVNIPGYNLNNASAVNFGGLYHHGACVPVPECTVDKTGTTMVPQILVAPVQISGTDESSDLNQVFPISSFTAYAIGPSATPGECASGGGGPPHTCSGGISGGTYWRVCLQVVTEKGQIDNTISGWGEKQTIMALTRCSSSNEPAGSGFTIYSN